MSIQISKKHIFSLRV